MKQLLLRALLFAVVGTFVVSPGGVIAEERTSKEKDDHAVIARAIESLEAAIKYLENSQDDFAGQKAEVLEDAKKAADQLRKIEKHSKKNGCRPGSLMLMGVGC